MLLFSARKNEITFNSLVVVYVVTQKWCKVRAHKRNNSVIGTIDFWPTLTYEFPISWLGAAGFDLFSRCVWCNTCLQKGKHSDVFSDDCKKAHNKYFFPVGWVVLGVFFPVFVNVLHCSPFTAKLGCYLQKKRTGLQLKWRVLVCVFVEMTLEIFSNCIILVLLKTMSCSAKL